MTATSLKALMLAGATVLGAGATLALPTAALQTFASEVPDNLDSEHKPYHVDRCHALTSNSETVRRYYPRWYRDPKHG